MKTKQDIYSVLKNVLVKEFELDEQQIHLDANLYEDLDLDSIDAVDLVVKLRDLTGKKIEPEAFKAGAQSAILLMKFTVCWKPDQQAT